MTKQKITKSLVTAAVAVTTCALCACFPKGYTDKEAKEQIERAEKIALDYIDKHTSGGRLEHNGLSVDDAQKPGDPALYLTDWVRGKFLDGGEYNMYVNTETGEVYTDLEWNTVNMYGRKLAQKLYGFDEDKMRVRVGGHLELPYKADDDAFGNVTISGMIPGDANVDKECVADILFGGRYEINYNIDISEDVDIDIFKKTDTKTLGNDVRLIVSQYPNDVFRQLIMGGNKNKADLYESKIAIYDSDAKDEEDEDEKESEGSGDKKMNKKAAGYDGTWYEQAPDGGILTVENGVMTYEGTVKDDSEFSVKRTKDGYELVADSDHFLFYEIQYYKDDDKIVTYTWPEDDGDGGYKPATFMREEYVANDEATIQYLAGEWEIMDGPGHIQEPGEERDILHFGNSTYHGASYSKNGEIARFTYELIDEYDTGSPLYNFLILHNRSEKPKFGWDEVRDSQEFQVFLANDYGHDYMMLRECGDERTGFATDALEYDRSTLGTWFFSRYVPWNVDDDYESDDRMPSTVGKEDKLRIKGDSFHAIKWTEFGNSCTLQRVEPVPVTLEDFDGKDVDGLSFVMPDDEYAYSTVNYEYKGREKYCNDGYFDPQFVYVTTDKNGQITEMSVIDYAYDGYYYDTATEVELDDANNGPVG